MNDAQAREAARAMWLAAQAGGEPISGTEIGRAFGRTDRWGRKQVEHARRQSTDSSPAAAAARTVPAVATTAGPRPPRRPAETTATAREPGRPAAGRPVVGSGDMARFGLDAVVTLLVAAVAAAASYGHMLEVALLAGEPLWIARAFPVTVDGLVLAALRRGESGRPWLMLGIAVSVAANVLAQFPDVATNAGPIVSAWPPLALYGTHRLLHHRRTSR